MFQAGNQMEEDDDDFSKHYQDDDYDVTHNPDCDVDSKIPNETGIGYGKGDGAVKAEEESSFTADFYHCGSDWSCLKFDSELGKSKRLKQTNLFHIWGLQSSDNKKKMKMGEILTQISAVEAGHGPSASHSALDTRVSSYKRRTINVKATKVQKCPFYKKIPGTSFTVDAFRYGCVEGCSVYFLSHFHSDHYGGLSKSWSHGPIYCTPITARLVRMCLSVNPSFVRPLELDVEHHIEGVKVTLLEANHCSGAAIIHFRLSNGKCFLHTGDFRASKRMQAYPCLLNQRINVLFLDTTYCNPKYRFPSKDEVLNFIVRTTRAYVKHEPKTLVVVGAYGIGKECVYIAISKALGVKIFANASKRKVLQSFGWPDLSGNLCSNGNDTPLHVLPISSLRHETLKNYLKTYQDQFAKVLAFRPTGWTFSESVGNQLDLIKPNSKGRIHIYGVPYSEHSSFNELQEFVQFLKPDKIIPTVNVANSAAREKMQSYFRLWLKG